MFICEILLFDWYFPQFCKSDVSKYGYLKVFQRAIRLQVNESRLVNFSEIVTCCNIFLIMLPTLFIVISLFVKSAPNDSLSF